jgi:hypothetical protein
LRKSAGVGVILADQALEVTGMGKTLVAARVQRALEFLNEVTCHHGDDQAVEKQGYLETRTPASMGLAITALLSGP